MFQEDVVLEGWRVGEMGSSLDLVAFSSVLGMALPTCKLLKCHRAARPSLPPKANHTPGSCIVAFPTRTTRKTCFVGSRNNSTRNLEKKENTRQSRAKTRRRGRPKSVSLSCRIRGFGFGFGLDGTVCTATTV
jgi:hypothetical protein